MLLAYIVGEGKSIRDLKGGRFNRLMQRPLVKRIIKTAGDGKLTPSVLGSVWPGEYHCYRLTLDVWGADDGDARFYNQTSRPGWNLVLQLNFSGRHNQAYYRMLKPRDELLFNYWGHPVALDGQHTLAWARIDLDLGTDEALIEEIQTDWIRRAIWSKRYLAALEKGSISGRRYVPAYVKGLGCDYEALSRYLEDALKPHMHMWDEAMLAAAIWFLKEEIGIGKIYYHTFNFGCQIKRITGSKPPVSLYTKLPDRFCFKKTRGAPGFLMLKNNRKIVNLLKHHDPRFYLLEL